MMNKRILMVFTALIVLALANNAFATRFDSFDASADCDGFLVEGSGKVGYADFPGVDVEYTINLEQDGEILDQYMGTVYCVYQADADPFTVQGSFDNLPSGTFSITGEFFMPHVTQGDSIKTFAFEMTCDDAPVASCERPRFWRQNPNAWPVEEITVGGFTYTKAEARDMMRGCFRYNVVKRLFRHTVAAKLNALSGADCGDSQAAINAGDDFLATVGFHQCLPRSVRRDARHLKNTLREFNRGDNANKSSWDAEDLDDYSDTASFGDLKAMYR